MHANITTETTMPNVADLEAAIRNRECVLFLGAGVHYPPPDKSKHVYLPADHPPLGSAFSNQLADECMAELNARPQADGDKKRAFLSKNRDNLQRTSWYYEVHHGRAALVAKIKEAVDVGKKPSPVLRALAEMDFPIVITTNYDQLFETALYQASKKPQVQIYDPIGKEPTRNFLNLPKRNERWLFKMHGCVSNTSSIVITDEDYIQFVMRMGDSADFHPVPEKIRVQFKEWRTLFLGYSLLDYNLRLLFRTLRRRVDRAERPPTFSVDPYPDPLVLATYGAEIDAPTSEPLVSFIVQDGWGFVPDLYQRVMGREMPP
jgi:hypothetical protein